MRLFVTPLSRLGETLRESRATRLLTLLSEGAAFEPPAGFAQGNFLRLAFHDIDAPRDGLTAPSAAHVAEILDFAGRCPPGEAMVVHCHAGISRSTAAAFAIACARRPDLGEDRLAALLRRLAPSATPNPLVVAHADAALGRGGRMVAAIRAIGRGADAFEGTPFRLDLG